MILKSNRRRAAKAYQAVYEHPWPVRFCHWVNAIALFVLVGSGLQIFRAFPSFGAKIPQKDLLNWPKAFAIGGWLGGALQWHLTFMWIYIASGIFYLAYQLFSGNFRQVLLTRKDVRGVWPMARYYFFFGQEAAAGRALQPAAEAGLHVRGGIGSAVGADRNSGLEAGSVFLAGMVSWAGFTGAGLAFCSDVGYSAFSFLDTLSWWYCMAGVTSCPC